MITRRWIYIVLAVVALLSLVAVVGCDENDVANGGDNGNGNGNGDGNGSGGSLVADATSIDFKVEWTNGERMEWRYRAKDLGTENLKFRMDITGDGFEAAYIFNGELRKVWMGSNGEWIAMPDEYWDEHWDDERVALEDYLIELYDWREGEWVLTTPEGTLRYYDVRLNPSLSDTLFQPDM